MFTRPFVIARFLWSIERGSLVSWQKLKAKRTALLLCLVMVLSGSQNCFAKKRVVFQESQVKSVFLYNLTKFITWPNEQQTSLKGQFTIGILGGHNFNATLEKVVDNEKVRDRQILLVFWDSLEDVTWSNLDMLFIGNDCLKDFEIIRKICRTKKIFTVGDTEGFCQLGGMVNLLTVNRRMKLEVNIDEVATSGFMVSGSVLKLATIVRTDTRKK